MRRTAEEEGAAEDEEHVGEDGAEEGDLYDAQHARLEREQRDDQLSHVAEGRVEQSTQPGRSKGRG